MNEAAITYCARHPQVETALRCGRCDTLICPRCLVQTPVGSRCPDCANVRRIPTIDVKPLFIARGLGASLLAGIAVGAFWGYAEPDRGLGGFFIFFIAMGMGWVISEAVSIATNRKRAQVLQGIAMLGAILAYVVHNLVVGVGPFPTGDLWGYLATVVAAVFAASRLSP
ncbi:MAG: hypothetical protein GEU75_13010 [Dehalococcoidia bacterium]|nr:hypothetical protein [Dehalococcoidia bacterium]